METNKSSNIFKFDHYDVFITVFNQNQLQITVIDPIQKFKFHQGLLILNNIRTTTLIRALQKSLMQVKMAMQVNKKEENTFLQIDIVVATPFLRPVEETILIKECGRISEYEILKSQIGNISSKFKIMKESNNADPHKVRCQNINGQKNFNSESPETITSLTLPKGKYLITLSFLAKVMSSWIYLYFQKDQSFIQNDGFYVESMSNYMPFVVKKQYRVTQNEENVEFSTNYASGYPLLLKNIVISALEINGSEKCLKCSRKAEVEFCKLSQITQKLSKFPSKPDELLKEYVSIYVQTHHLSDDLFLTICENKYLTILLQNSPKVQQSTCVLQCLNLLITNTKNSNQLAYFLAQKPLHQFLFPANLLQKESQFIQYYIQLLKTILMKISQKEQNRQLIHMFCNQKYTSFPLFTNVTLLACFKNQMIQVTARQCILVIIKMIKNGRGYQVYLGQPAMIILVARLSTQFLRPGSDEQGISKFFADLLYELKNNKIPLIMVSNIICNVIIVCNIQHRFEVALKFVDMLGKTIETKICQQIESGNKMGKQEQEKDQNEQSEQKGQKKQNEKYGDLLIICATFFQVIAKYLTKQYIHPIYFSAHIQFSLPSSTNLQKQEQSKQKTLCLPLTLVCPQTQELCKILNAYSLKKYVDEGNSVSEMELGRDCMEDFIEKGKSFIKSREFTKLLEGHLKQVPKQTSFFNKMFNRQNPQQLNIKYLKQISQFSSLVLEKGQPVFLNLVKQFIPSTSPFVIEYYNLSSLLQDCKKAFDEKELVFNQFFNSWSFNSTSLDIVHQLCKRLSEFPDSNRRPQLLLPKLSVTPFMFFLQNFQSYLENQIHNHINRHPKNKQLVQSMPNIITFAKICSSLNLVVSQISTKYLTKQLLNLHSQMQNSLFENGFSGVFQFINLKRKIYELEIQSKMKVDETHIKKQRQNGMKIIKVKSSLTFLKICAFDCIYKIMEPKAKSVDKYFETKWNSTFDQQKNHQLTHNQQVIDQFKVQFQNEKDCDLLFIKIMKPPSVVIRVNLNGEKLLQSDLMQSSLCSDPISCGFYLSELKQQELKACSSQVIVKIRQKWQKIKQDFTANITNSTLQYISITNDKLNEIDRKTMQLQSDFFVFPI